MDPLDWNLNQLTYGYEGAAFWAPRSRALRRTSRYIVGRIHVLQEDNSLYCIHIDERAVNRLERSYAFY